MGFIWNVFLERLFRNILLIGRLLIKGIKDLGKFNILMGKWKKFIVLEYVKFYFLIGLEKKYSLMGNLLLCFFLMVMLNK